MTLLKTAFSRLSHKPTPVIATNMAMDSWCHQLPTQPTRFIRKIDMCTATAAGHNAWGAPVEKGHLHTLLRVCLVPTARDPSVPEDVLLVERVLSTNGAHHGVTRIAEAVSTSGTLFHPEVHDRVCVVAPDGDGHVDLAVERTLAFVGDGDGVPAGAGRAGLTLAQFAQVLALVSRTSALICAGDDCRFQSRSFAFTCLAALTPRLPPSASARGGVEGEEVLGTSFKYGPDWVDDSTFESGAESFLTGVPWTARDPESMRALRLMVALKSSSH